MLLVAAVAAVVVLPVLKRAHMTSAGGFACINNLRQIDAGKEQALYYGKLSPDADCDSPRNRGVVNQYIKGNATPICPNGGTYRYGKMNQEPTCGLFDPKDSNTYAHDVSRGKTQ